MLPKSAHKRPPIHRLAERIRKNLSLLHPKRKLLVAVSGGADSVALLHLLREAGHDNLVIAHFNHRLRGAASRADATSIKRLSEKLKLPVEIGAAEVRKMAKERKLSIETAAREARYAFLATTAKKHRLKTLLLAHHADDQVETCLFQFLRGSGAAGLAGMKPRSQRTIDGVTLELHRPLLEITKEEILAYLKERKLSHREDASNAIPDTSRNKLRLKILPLIEELLGSSFRGAIRRNAKIFADEEEFLSSLALPMAGTRELSVKALRQLHPALQRRILHAWLKKQNVLEPGFAEVELTASLLEQGGTSKINLPGNYHVRRRAGVLFLEKGKSAFPAKK